MFSECLKIIYNLAVDKAKSKMIFNSGFLDIAMMYLEAHIQNPEIASKFFMLLTSLSQNEDASEAITIKCSHIILGTILEKIAQLDIVEKGVLLTSYLVKIQKNVEYIIQNKGLDIFLEVLKKYINKIEIVNLLLDTIDRISVSSEENRKIVLEKTAAVLRRLDLETNNHMEINRRIRQTIKVINSSVINEDP